MPEEYRLFGLGSESLSAILRPSLVPLEELVALDESSLMDIV